MCNSLASCHVCFRCWPGVHRVPCCRDVHARVAPVGDPLLHDVNHTGPGQRGREPFGRNQANDSVSLKSLSSLFSSSTSSTSSSLPSSSSSSSSFNLPIRTWLGMSEWSHLFEFGVMCCMLNTFHVSSRIVAKINESSHSPPTIAV